MKDIIMRPIFWVNVFALAPAITGFFGSTMPAWIPAVSVTALAVVNLALVIVLDSGMVFKKTSE